MLLLLLVHTSSAFLPKSFNPLVSSPLSVEAGQTVKLTVTNPTNHSCSVMLGFGDTGGLDLQEPTTVDIGAGASKSATLASTSKSRQVLAGAQPKAENCTSVTGTATVQDENGKTVRSVTLHAP